MKKFIISLLVIFTLAVSMISPAFAAKGVDIYLDEISMSSYIFHQGLDYNANNGTNQPWIGVRFEHPDEQPWYVNSEGVNTPIESKHTIGGHEPFPGRIDHSDFEWDISAYAANNSLPFSAQVCKAGGTQNAEYIVLVDGKQVWTSGNTVTAADGLISVSYTIPQGSKTLTLRADRGADETHANGEYHWVDAKITLPAGSKITRMETKTFEYLGNGGATNYFIGYKMDKNGDGIADFVNTTVSSYWTITNPAWCKFTTKNVISGHQTGENDGNAYIKWDITDFGAGYFTAAVCNNWPDARFNGIFSILVDGEEKTVSSLMRGLDGLWRGTVQVPADAKELEVRVNWGDDNITCGAFTVADPIFVEDPPAPDPDDPTPATSDALVSAAVVVAAAAAAAVIFGKRKRA